MPVGEVPALRREHDTESNRRLIRGVYPRRIDLMILFGQTWWMVEGKIAARHYVLGQILSYAFWWERGAQRGKLGRLVVVTDAVDPDMRPVFRAAGVDLVELSAVELGVADAAEWAEEVAT
ncbi:MAG: hypothetical protein V3S19_07185 [Gemmatimonadales bacterium]